VHGGDRAGQTQGHFFAPTIVVGAPASTDLLREETFGPVAPIVPVDSLDEAISLANGTRFGLGANVYTRDLATAVRCIRELKAGTVWINDPLTDNDAGPFGGFKQSGLGRELGREGLEASRRPSTCTWRPPSNGSRGGIRTIRALNSRDTRSRPRRY
jgi:acyl-CoA reductase-like NAD-dependent aldehyde dehydrogenase